MIKILEYPQLQELHDFRTANNPSGIYAFNYPILAFPDCSNKTDNIKDHDDNVNSISVSSYDSQNIATQNNPIEGTIHSFNLETQVKSIFFLSI